MTNIWIVARLRAGLGQDLPAAFLSEEAARKHIADYIDEQGTNVTLLAIPLVVPPETVS